MLLTGQGNGSGAESESGYGQGDVGEVHGCSWKSRAGIESDVWTKLELVGEWKVVGWMVLVRSLVLVLLLCSC